MDKSVFEKMVWDLSLYFERKAPKQEIMALWFDEIRDIPGKYAHALTAEIKKLDTWPRNLPAFMRGKTAQFQETSGEDNIYKIHPRRFHPENYADPKCKTCHGEGLYDFPMDWPVAKENGKLITKRITRRALCPCTEQAEYGF